MKERTAIIAGERVAIRWNEAGNKLEAEVNGRSYPLEFRTLEDGAFWFGSNGLSVEAFVSAKDEGYEVAINGHRIRVEFLESNKKLHRQSGGAHSGVVDVRAPMPGKVVRILRGNSEEVQAKQGIIVIEAMKMQNEIRSPKTGKIVDLRVSEGDAVGLGDLIARIE